MRILAIGGTGFIGRFTVPLLAGQGHDVSVFHRGTQSLTGVHSIQGDRRNLAAADFDFSPDVVIDFLLSNRRQADQLAALFPQSRLVALSSCDVYRAIGIFHGTEPGNPDNTPIREDSPLRANLHPYPPGAVQQFRSVFPWLEEDYDKIPVERTILEAGGAVLRLPMVYGPGDPLHRFLPIVKRVDDGCPVILLGEGTASWRAIRGYVENVAWAVALAATNQRAAGRVYNVGDPENFTEHEWQSRIAASAGFRGKFVMLPHDRLPAHLQPRGNVRQHWNVDSSRIRQELGYAERVPRAEGIARTVAWERAHPPADLDDAQYDFAAEDRAYAAFL